MKKEATIMIVGFLMMVGGWSALLGLRGNWALVSFTVGIIGHFIFLRGLLLLIRPGRMKKEAIGGIMLTAGVIIVVGGLTFAFTFILSWWAPISLVVAFIVGFPVAIVGSTLLDTQPSTKPQPEPQKPFDPWIKAPKVKKTEKKNKPLPKIWKDKVLTSN